MVLLVLIIIRLRRKAEGRGQRAEGINYVFDSAFWLEPTGYKTPPSTRWIQSVGVWIPIRLLLQHSCLLPSAFLQSARGRYKAEEHLTNLLEDIKKLVDSQSQTDPSFKSQRLYTRLTASQVRKLLIEKFDYPPSAEGRRQRAEGRRYKLCLWFSLLAGANWV